MTSPITYPLIAVTKKYLSAFNRMVGDLPIDRYQYVLVLIESHNEKLTQKALAELLQIDKSYMVTILDYLTDKGYVLREKNPKDRREQLIRLTPRAKKDLVQIKDAFAELNEKSLQNIDDKQIAIYNEVIKTIERNLSHSNPTEIIVDFKKI